MKQFSLAREVFGGGVSALAAIPLIIACAMIVAAPLREFMFPIVLQSAIVSAIGAALIGALLSGTAVQISGPRLMPCMLLAASAAAYPNLSSATLLLLIAAMTVVAGAAQVLLGLMRLGSLIRYLPYPVLAGFVTAINLTILWNVAPLLLAGWMPGFSARPEWPQSVSVVAMAITVIAALLCARTLPRVPSVLAGLVVGCVAFYTIGHAGGAEFIYRNEDLSRVSLAINAITLYDLDGWTLSRSLIPEALALAVLCSLESLMSAVAVQKLTGEPLHANHELVGQGITNILIGLAGGMVAAGTPLRGEAAARAGANTRAAGVISGVVLLALYMTLARQLPAIPAAVIGGCLLAMILQSLKVWGFDPLRRLSGEVGGRQPRGKEMTLAALAFAVTAGFGPVAGVAMTIACAMALFIAKADLHVVRRVLSGQKLRSSLQRSAASRALLEARGDRICFVELGGPLFFGSADALLREVQGRIPSGGTLIIDLERVSEVDSAGAFALREVAALCTQARAHLWLAGRQTLERFRPLLEGTGLFDLVPAERQFDNGDQALERAETQLIAASGEPQTEVETSLYRGGLFSGLNAEEQDHIKQMLVPRELKAGQTLFREGDTVDGLYIIYEGQISVHIDDASGVSRRIAAFNPGTIIGEIAFVEGGTRSARAIAEKDSRMWLLKPDALADIDRVDPKIVHQLIANVAREIAGRLRNTTVILRQR